MKINDRLNIVSKVCFVVVLNVVCTFLFSQTKPVTLKLTKNSNKSLSCIYTKNVPGSYSVNIKIVDIENSMSPKQNFVISGSGGVLFTLNPLDPSKNIHFSYRYKSALGKICSKIDSSYNYLLPFNEGTEIEYHNLSHLGHKYFDQEMPQSFKAFQFVVDSAETVCSVRKGVVVKIVDDQEPDTSNVYSLSSKQNEVIVEHSDGTLARYVGFGKGKVFVKPGDVVFPNSQLGVLTAYDKRGMFQLRFALYYRSHDLNDDSDVSMEDKKSPFEYVTPYFLTDEGCCHLEAKKRYVVDVRDEIITQEFSRKELKKWKSLK